MDTFTNHLNMLNKVRLIERFSNVYIQIRELEDINRLCDNSSNKAYVIFLKLLNFLIPSENWFSNLPNYSYEDKILAARGKYKCSLVHVKFIRKYKLLFWKF